MKKVVCAHLYNDFSGSPLVLSTVINGFMKRGVEVELVTSQNTDGFLSNLNVKYVNNNYQFAENKLIRIFKFFYTQLVCFLKMFRYRKEEVVVYVNTLLPFGVAIAGKLMGKKVIFHIHETSVKPPFLKSFLKWVCAKTASEIIYVSNFLQQQEPIGEISSKVVYNALSNDFVQKAEKYQSSIQEKESFIVLMLCSLKAYKGVNEFVKLADQLSHLDFHLVLNAVQADIDQYFSEFQLPNNLTIFPKHSNVHPFYAKASLVLNLSHPEQWVETFGMTLLEGMQYGLPAISPPVGGCTEFVESGVNGYQIDQRYLGQLIACINRLYTDPRLYNNMSSNAVLKAATFSVEAMCENIVAIVMKRKQPLIAV